LRTSESWALLAVLVAAIVATGYGVFVFFIEGFSPTTGTLSLIAFAVIAGIATFFSPCSFSLMPGYLARHLRVMDRDPNKARTSVVSNGLAAAAGSFSST
jgi:cytochrome c biogenesis protein CcdA